jgi:hypothetical protein
MVKKLMESFDIDAALLARFSVFDPVTLTVKTTFGDVDKQLEWVEEDLGINQGWNADSELGDDSRVDLIGHREALAMTLRDWVNDVDDANCSGPSRRTNFLQSTGNSTNNSDATTRLHTQRATALKTIELVDKNNALENNLHEAQAQMAAIVAQNKLLQEQLSGSHYRPTVNSESADPGSPHADPITVPMEVEEGEAMQIRGGGVPPSASHPSPAGSVLFYVDDTDLMGDTSAGLLFLPHSSPPRSLAPLVQGIGTSPASWLTSTYPVPFPQGAGELHRKQAFLTHPPGGSEVGGEQDY